MRLFFQLQLILLSFSILYSCDGRNNISDQRPSIDTFSTEPVSEGIVVTKSSKPLNFDKAVLFTISSSIYKASDTTWDFSDGMHAYEQFFHGGAFVDSSGKPIHGRFTKASLTAKEVDTLREQYLSHFYDGIGHSCTPIYRDVLVFYDKSNKAIAQVQICFGCHETAVYPTSYFDYSSEISLNWVRFKDFISHIKE
jgi:hypothetical protein